MHSTDINKTKSNHSTMIKLMCKNNTDCAHKEEFYYIKCSIDMKERYFYFIWTKDERFSEGTSCEVYFAFEIDTQGNVIDIDTYKKPREWIVKIFNAVDKYKHAKELKYTKRFSDAAFGQFIDAHHQKHDYILMEKKLDDDLFNQIANPYSDVMLASFDQKIKLFCMLLLQASRMHNRTVQGGPIGHCDIKPENTRVSTDNGKITDAEIIDFDKSKNLKGPQRTKKFETVGGSLPYSPLETYTTQQIGTKSDVYSLAIMFCQILTKDPLFAHNMTGWMFKTNNVEIDWSFADTQQIQPQTKKPEIKFDFNPPELKSVVTKFLWRMLDLDYNKRPHTNAALKFFTTLYNCCLASTTRTFAGRDDMTITQPPDPDTFVLNWATLELICADLWDDYETLSAAPKHMQEGMHEAVLFIVCGKLNLLKKRHAATFTAYYSCSKIDDAITSTHNHGFLGLDFINRHYSIIQTELDYTKHNYPTIDLTTCCSIPNTAFARQFSSTAKHKHYRSAPRILTHTRKITTAPLSCTQQNNDVVNKILFVNNWVICAYKNGRIAMQHSRLNQIKWKIELSNQIQNLQFLLLPDDQLLCVYIDQYNIVAAKLLNCEDGRISELVDYNSIVLSEFANDTGDLIIIKTLKGKPLTTTRIIVGKIDNTSRFMLQQLVRLPSPDKALSVSWSDKFIYIINCQYPSILNRIAINDTSEVILLRNGDFICKTEQNHMFLCKF